jgi:prepilin-type N-terminal cleavage/methylation domain-containing protein
MMCRIRRGVTLIELVVTIAVLGILSSVAAASLLKARQPDRNGPTAIAEHLRRDAVHSGAPKSGVVMIDSLAVVLTAFPDGSIAADSALHVDRLTGRMPHASP